MTKIVKLLLSVCALTFAFVLVSCDFEIPEETEETVSISGTITLPATVSDAEAVVALVIYPNKIEKFVIISDINGNSFNYSINDVASGDYVLTSSVYLDPEAENPDYDGMYLNPEPPYSYIFRVGAENLTGMDFALTVTVDE